jgi:hypothetical protein
MKRGLILEINGLMRFVTETEIRNVANEAILRLGENDKNILDALINYICKQMEEYKKPDLPKPLISLFTKGFQSINAVGNFIPTNNPPEVKTPITRC